MKRVLYFTKVKTKSGKFIIKYGWTNNIEVRQRSLSTKFGNSTFIDVFEVDQNMELELKIKQNPDFDRFRIKEEFIESTETFLMTMDEYEELLMKFVKLNIKYFQGFNREQFIEMEKIKLENNKIDFENNKIDFENNKIDLHNRILDILCSRESTDIITQYNQIASQMNPVQAPYNQIASQIDVINPVQAPSTTRNVEEDNPHEVSNNPRINTRQRNLQQYDPFTLQLIKTFDGIMDVIRTFPEMSKFGVKNAALKNTVYRDFRWFFIESDAEHIQYEIPPTVEITTSIPQHVALLNLEKTRIEDVYVSQAEAAKQLEITRKQSVNDSIKKGSLVKSKYYFCLFNDCSQNMQEDYLSRVDSLPETNSPGLHVEQLDIRSGEIINTYNSMADVLKEACEKETPCKGFLWRFA
jgi:hypothetical protein